MKQNIEDVKTNATEELIELKRHIILTGNALNKARQKELNRFNLDLRWSAIIWAIKNLGQGATPQSIAKMLLRQRHTISHMLGRLEEAGIIEKVRDLDRKNRVRAVLTVKGERLYRELSARESVKRIFEGFSQRERDELSKYIEDIRGEALRLLSIEQVVVDVKSTRPDFHLFKLLVDTAEAIDMIREQELREFNINVERSSVLTAINNLGDKASPTTISHYLQRNCNTVTSILGKMEKEGLVEISPAGNTASRYVVRLSARGKAVSQKSIRISVVYDIIGRLTPEERTKFARYLERLRETAVNELAMNS